MHRTTASLRPMMRAFGDRMSDVIEYSKKLRKMSADELAHWQKGFKQHTQQYILAEKEWDRRMLMEQVKWQKISIIAALAGAILGSVITIAAGILIK